MAGFLGYTVAAEIYDFIYRGTAITIGADLYMRLLVSASNRSGGGTESNYSGYARLVLPRGTTIFAPTASGLITNSVLIEYPIVNALGNGDPVFFDIVDTASGAFTKIYNAGPIIPPKALQVGKPPKFKIGALKFTL